MDLQTLGFALAAGLVAALNPCGFAMLPAYLTLVIVGDGGAERGRAAAIGRALVATLAMALGFLVVFGTFGLLIAPLAASVQQYLPVITVIIGAGLVGIGIWMLTGREFALFLPKPGRGAPTARLGSMFGYGLAYAIASLSCTIGPFLAVTSATFRSGSFGGGVLAYLAYGAGMTLVVGVLATAAALASSTVTTKFRRLLPHINRVGGGLVVLVGVYVGYYGVYELRLFFGDGDARDPIIEAAGVVQETLVRWVEYIGVLPLLAVLAGVVLVAVVLVRRRAGRR
ncbi:cytochrome c biogenesis protein CcdA [Allokutzneria sp. A3M-2-11 16]|uniref:cytochrome c biogenesis CcdA family protein n=1 Tax=Allokutzneria sp. A3M-2-11 16 TaxID=2962043 RepID=UPI0020B8B026|nr:cytochrome c biogenesis protein CcdA [Allokutzneria sp. A3M-2-11 16]MCP3801973.1 cytochrome c biogenesis protein CcdA [Allokutzneria sp. A3M-2-11 16]